MGYIEEWDKLDEIITKSSHFGGYYDLRECLFDIVEESLEEGEQLVQKFRDDNIDIFKIIYILHSRVYNKKEEK